MRAIQKEKIMPENNCNKMADELGNPWQQNILFIFHFLLLCNSIKCTEYYDSKGVHKII